MGPELRRSAPLTHRERVKLLMEEYRALYAMVTFRNSSMERRVPIAGATLAAFLGAVTVLPMEARLIYLVGLPIALLFFLRTTINHARSVEDALRRIEEIEHRVNAYADEELLTFQSTHPSRLRVVGGRTGRESVRAVFVTCVLMLAACVFLFHQTAAVPSPLPVLYDAFVAVSALLLIYYLLELRDYRYRKQPYDKPRIVPG
jgi:hypothetical protein